MTPAKAKTPPPPIRSGFCNPSWSLDRADGRASHARCNRYDCPCPCHTPDPSPPGADTGEPHDAASGPLQAQPEPVDSSARPGGDPSSRPGGEALPDPLAGLTVTQAVDLCHAAAEQLNRVARAEAVNLLRPVELIRLLDSLRAAEDILRDIDRSLVTAAYTKGKGDHVIDGIGPVTIDRTAERRSWDERGIAQGVLDARMAELHPDGTLPTPWEVLDWFLEVVHVDYARVTALKALGLDPGDFSDWGEGRPRVTLPRRS